MEEQRSSFVFYRSFFEAIQDVNDEQKLILFNAICEFALNDKKPKLDGICATLYKLIEPQIIANIERYKNGKKGGRPSKKKTNGFEDKKPEVLEEKTNGFEIEKPNVNDNVNDNVNVNDNENINDNENEPKTKVLDPFFSKEVTEFFQLVKEYANNQYNDLKPNRLLVAEMLPKISLDMEIWKQVLKRSRSMGHKINGEFKPLSLKNMLEHYSEILDGTYGLVNKWE